MDRTKVIELSEKAGGLFRLTVLLQKRVREIVGGAPKLVVTEETDPINIAMLEVEAGAIELVDLSEQELAALEAESKIATEEAEILEALRTRVSSAAAGAPAPTGAPAAKKKEALAAKAKAAPKKAPATKGAPAADKAAEAPEPPAAKQASEDKGAPEGAEPAPANAGSDSAPGKATD